MLKWNFLHEALSLKFACLTMQVIEEKMIDVQQNYSTDDVCVLGLYGMGGIGKSSICKALCNEFFTRFHGKVCYAKLGKKKEEKLLREVLQNLISKSSFERLSGCGLAKVCSRFDTVAEEVLGFYI